MAAYTGGDYNLAARCFNAAIEAQHDAADAHYQLGLAYLKLNRLEDAKDSFLMAAHFGPAFAEAHYGLALVAQRRGEQREASSELRQAISFRADYADAYNALGASALELGRSARSRCKFRARCRARPDFAHAHNNLGYVLFMTSESTNAARRISKPRSNSIKVTPLYGAIKPWCLCSRAGSKM
jgi:tetratricopeptide (TPR) repeat protein